MFSNHQAPLTGFARDKSFGAYLRATTGSRGAGLRLICAFCFAAALIVKQGLFGVEIFAITVVGGMSLAYPLWRQWGRDSAND